MNAMKLAENIKKYRKEVGLTQEQLATELNTTRQSISRWEQGTLEPDIQMVVALANYFNITVDQLVQGHDHGTPKQNHQTDAPSHSMNFWEFLSKRWWVLIAVVAIICGTLAQIFA